MATFRVVRPFAVVDRKVVRHFRHPGSVVELTEEQAAPLADSGHVEVVEERKPRPPKPASDPAV